MGLLHMTKCHLTPSGRRWLRSVPLPSGRARFPVLSKSYCLGCSSTPSLCRAWSYRLPYRKGQEAYTGHWKGQLLWRFGRDPNFVVIRRDSEWPTERERLGYICNPRSLREGTETSRPVATVAVPPLSCRVTGLAPQRKHELMRCTCCLLYSRCDQRQLDAIVTCQCPLAHLVTLKVDWSLWWDPNFVGHPTWRLHSLLQGTRVTHVTEPDETRMVWFNSGLHHKSDWAEDSSGFRGQADGWRGLRRGYVSRAHLMDMVSADIQGCRGHL